MNKFLNIKNLFDLYNNKKILDNRGYFFKVFDYKDFQKSNFKHIIKQVNISNNKKKGTIRGLHYQINKHKEQKIIICIKGSIFDVLVDIRKNSKNFLKCFTNKLTEKNGKILVIPMGFAHGYQTLEKNTKILYLHSNTYSKKNERSLNPMDKKLNIKWPVKTMHISIKDKNTKMINDKM